VRLPSLWLAALRAMAGRSGPIPALARRCEGLAARGRARVAARLAAQGDPCLIRLEGVTLRVPLPLALAFLDRRFDRLTIARLRRLVRPGMLAVDVGAHVGFYTLLLARLVAPAGRVVAVEPAPENASLLARNLEFAPERSVEIVQAAAGREDRERTFVLSDSSDTHSFYPHPLSRSVGSVVVRERRLDRLLAASPDFVKIDVEGAELEVLQGLSGLVCGDRPRAVLVEVNPACLEAAGASPAALLEWLEEHGFAPLELADEQAGVVHRGGAACRAALARRERPGWFANLLARRA